MTGPELVELDPALGFAAEWVAVSDLQHLPVWPRAVAEHLAGHVEGSAPPDQVLVVEDDREAWEGTRWSGELRRRRACIVLVADGHLAVIDRWRPPTDSSRCRSRQRRDRERPLPVRVT